MPALRFFGNEFRGLEYDADGEEVVNVFEGDSFPLHLRPDGEDAFDASCYRKVDAALGEALPDGGDETVYEFVSVWLCLVQFPDNLEVLFRIPVAQAQVFQLGFDGIQTKSVGQRSEQIEGFARYLHLLVARHGGHCPHVMQPVGYLDEDDPHIVRQRQQHFAEIGGLFGGVRVHYPGHFGQAVHHVGNLLPENGIDFLHRVGRILHYVVQKSGRHGFYAQPYLLHYDFGDGEGVQYIRFPAAAQYPLMGLLCEEESLAYQLPVLLLLDYFRAG